MLADERLKLADQPRVLAQRELRLDSLLQSGQPGFLEPRDLWLCERLVREIREGRATPQPERLPEPPGRGTRITVLQRASTLPNKRLEAFHIHLARFGLQQVPARTGHQQPVAKRLAQARHVPLNDLDRARGCLLAPELVYQAIRRDHLAAMDQQHGQQRPLLGCAYRYRAVWIDNLKRSENVELNHPRCPCAQPYHRGTRSQGTASAGASTESRPLLDQSSAWLVPTRSHPAIDKPKESGPDDHYPPHDYDCRAHPDPRRCRRARSHSPACRRSSDACQPDARQCLQPSGQDVDPSGPAGDIRRCRRPSRPAAVVGTAEASARRRPFRL